MNMITNLEAHLTLGQWLSPAFPVGAFAYSHGVETAIEAGTVCDGETLFDWLSDVLAHGAGRNDALFLYAAYRAENAKELARIDAMVSAFAASAERLHETRQQGAAFAKTIAAIAGFALPAYAYPVALGRAARLAGLSEALTAAAYLQAFAANLTSAAVRLVPLGQTEGQAVTRRLQPLCLSLAETAQNEGLEALSSTAFLSDIAAMRHETLPVRIFRT